MSRSSATRPSLKAALPWAALAATALAALTLVPGAWGTAFGQTVPRLTAAPVSSTLAPGAGGPAGSAAATLTTPDGQPLATVSVDAAIFSAAPAGTSFNVTLSSTVPMDDTILNGTDDAAPVVQTLSLPVQIGLDLVDPQSGESIALPDDAAGASVRVGLPPVLTEGAPAGAEIGWLVQLKDDSGQTIGFEWVPVTIDSVTGQVVLSLPAGLLASNPEIVPVAIVPSQIFIQPGAHVFTGPLADGLDLGEADTRSSFQAIGPAVGGRVPVRNVDTGDLGWVETGDAAPAAAAPAAS